MDSASIFSWILNTAYILTILATLIVVISDNRNPTKTLSWVLVLLFLPAIGIILYYVFGMNYRNKKKRNLSYHEFTEELFSHLDREGSPIENKSDKVIDKYKGLVNILSHNYDSVVYSGSAVEIITSGKRKFDALFHDLENAKHHIHMEYFYFRKDETGKKVKEILMRKASEGVKVRFLYENVANIAVSPRYYYEMRKAGVEVVPFAKRSLPWIRRNLNIRNHRKVVVIDGEIGYIGGMNIGNEYANEWRDTHLRILGKGVYALQYNFLYDWYSSAGKKIDNWIPYFPACKTYSDNLIQIDAESPDSDFAYLLLANIEIISKAENYIYIQTPYFLPSESLLQALQTAAIKGVDVRLMVSRKSDFFFMDYATQSYYTESLRAGVKIYECQDKFIHAKTLVSDDYLSVIGSANMDFRSLEYSYEINSYLYDGKLAHQNKQIFLEDLKGCKEIIFSEWLKRPFYRKLFESIIKLFAPVL